MSLLEVVMSGGFSMVASALETASEAISGRAEEFGSVGDSFSGSGSSGTAFGNTSMSGQLSEVTSRFSTLHGGQFGAAQRFLNATADCLSKAREGYVSTDEAVGQTSATLV
jgi:hypothetical protein